MNVMTGKRILLGVSGSLSAYQAAELADKLVELGAIVDVFMTFSAKKHGADISVRPVFSDTLQKRTHNLLCRLRNHF